MKKRNEFLETFIDGFRQYVNGLILILSFTLPILLDLKTKIDDLLDTSSKITEADIQNLFLLFAIKNGNFLIGITFLVFTIFFIRKYNSEKKLNSGNHYHKHTYLYYWFCSHILGYRMCSLILVPIFMQIKLIINDTFSDFDYGEDEIYKEDIVDDIVSERKNFANTGDSLINLVISDTYPIGSERLPGLYSNNPTIFISRSSNKTDRTRVFSKTLVETINNEILGLENNVTINFFATTNAKNTYFIVNTTFKKASRSNVCHLVVFPQSKGNLNDWKFDECGKKIF